MQSVVSAAVTSDGPAVSDPQEAQLGAEVGSVSDVGEEGLVATGAAGRHAGLLRHPVVVDVFRQDAASLQENSATGRWTFDLPGITASHVHQE